MIIAVTSDARVELREPNDFRNFKILVEGAGDTDFVRKALAGLASVEPDGKFAWVSQDALRRWQGREQPPEWIASFDEMLDSVRRFGWVDDERRAVRGHIERA
jgi:hypothetical protein